MKKMFRVDWDNETVEGRQYAIKLHKSGVYAGENTKGEGIVVYVNGDGMKVKTKHGDGQVTIDHYDAEGKEK